MRKTVNVESLVQTVNTMLSCSTCSADTRQGMMNVLEGVLHDAGAYKGFRYLHSDEVPAGELPGVNFEQNNLGHRFLCADITARFANTDRTRVQY
jgi:hypothetical protein